MLSSFRTFCLGLAWFGACAGVPLHAATPIEPLTIRGEDFVDPSGQVVRFWGQNLVSLYPDHATSDALAKNLAAMQVNLARPHHNLRRSKDWNPWMKSGALLTYDKDSRHFDADALDRFDYLNAALRDNGIYLAISINWTRRYLPGDVDILTTDAADREAWMAAMAELNGWHWKKNFDVYKMLPVLDERVALLNEEFARAILGHVNPYTKQSYARDPQVLTIELLNEASTEYNIICNAEFPEYWQKKLLARWADFARSAGVEPGDLYKPSTPEQTKARAAFLNGLDRAYYERMIKVVRSTGSDAPMIFSNLWRGDNALQREEALSAHVEDHAYANPLVTADRKDLFFDKSFTQLKDKPYFLGEFNETEGEKNIQAQAPYRTMLPLAAAAYGSLQNWSGVVWFSWQHGTDGVGPDGWAKKEARSVDIGQMMQDGMMLDHQRTAGILFRKGLIQRSTRPITLHLGQPIPARNYPDLMRHKITVQPGWQNIHGVRNTFSETPADQASAPWLTMSPPNPLVSDTGQIIKDIDRQQLTVAAPSAEAFSGKLDGNPPAGLKQLAIEGTGFATVIVVADDAKPLADSERLIISRTNLGAANSETDGPRLRIAGLKAPAGKQWTVQVTRPRELAGTPQALTGDAGPAGSPGLTLPDGGWRECELLLK